MRHVLTAGALLLVLCAATIPILWYAYTIGHSIEGGRYTHDYALSKTFQFSLITTVLTSVIWIWLTRISKVQTTGKLFLKGTLLTFTILTLYMFVVVLRRQMWTSAQGVNEWAMFYGETNGFFFSEVGPLSFFLEVVPSISIISGAFLCLNKMIACRYIKPSANP